MCMTALSEFDYEALRYVPNDPPEYLKDRIEKELDLS
jgi:hypothetical protein